MAKETAKRNARTNATRLRWFRIITVAVNAVYLLSLVLSSEASVLSIWSVCWILFWATQEYAALLALTAHGAPQSDASGDIVDCNDLSDPQQLGLYSYAQDLLWVCWAVQLLTVVSGWFLFLYIPVPAMAFSKVFPFLKAIFPGGRSAQSQTAMPEQEDDLRTRLQRRRDQVRQRKGKAAKE